MQIEVRSLGKGRQLERSGSVRPGSNRLQRASRRVLACFPGPPDRQHEQDWGPAFRNHRPRPVAEPVKIDLHAGAAEGADQRALAQYAEPRRPRGDYLLDPRRHVGMLFDQAADMDEIAPDELLDRAEFVGVTRVELFAEAIQGSRSCRCNPAKPSSRPPRQQVAALQSTPTRPGRMN